MILKVYRPRRYFKITELKLMRRLAEDGRSQSYAARMLDRDPGTIAQAAKRYGIQFHAKSGPSPADVEVRRRKRADHCRLYRQRRGATPRVFRSPEVLTVTRFDDPRVMV